MVKLVWKVVIIGDPAVGKTSIRRKYLGETTIKEYIYTIGADFATKRLKLSDNLLVQYQIFDLAGQQKFDKVRASFYSGSQAAILVYDITDKDTLLNLPKWVMEVKKNCDEALSTFIVVGNKIDLVDEKEVSDEALKKFLKDLSKEMGHEILHLYTSALTGENIDLLFKKTTNFLLLQISKENPQIAKIIKEDLQLKHHTAEIMIEKKEEQLRIETSVTTEIDPLEKRLQRMELEIENIKIQLAEVDNDLKYIKDVILKYLHKNKEILDELNLGTK